jgi:zinc/manganese transport system substrate-binding protein
MRTRTFAAALCAAVLGLCAPPAGATGATGTTAAADPLRVVTTLPDLADICRAIGGERVDVSSIAKGTENAHAVQVRPSTLVAMSKAELFVEMGLSLEHTYVPGLLEAARNQRIRPGQPGFVDCSVGWETIEVPAGLSRQQGVDLHPGGNPHYNLDPRGGRHIAGRIAAALITVDPDSAEHYRARLAAYEAELAEAERRWQALGQDLRGRKLVTFHRDFSYFAAAHGMEIVGTVEPQPGIAPTPAHVAELVALMKEQEVGVIVCSAWSNTKTVKDLAQKAGARVVEIPQMVGGAKGADTWIAKMDVVYARLREGFGLPADDG